MHKHSKQRPATKLTYYLLLIYKFLSKLAIKKLQFRDRVYTNIIIDIHSSSIDGYVKKMAIILNDRNWATGRLCLVWLLGNNSVLFGTLNVVDVAYWLQDHLLQQVDKHKNCSSVWGLCTIDIKML